MITRPMHVYRLTYGGYESGGAAVLLSERCWTQGEFEALFDQALATAARESWEEHLEQLKWEEENLPGRDYRYPWISNYSYMHERVVELLCAEHGFCRADESPQAEFGLFGDTPLCAEPNPAEDPPELQRARRVVLDAVPEARREWESP